MDNNPIHNINYEEIAQAVEKRKEASPDLRTMSDKEIIRQIISERAPQQQESPQPSSGQQKPTENDNLPAYAQNASPKTQEKVNQLIQTTLEKGLEGGIKEAMAQEPFIIDLYHDTLSEILLDELKKKGLLS